MNALKQYHEELNALDAQRAEHVAKMSKIGDVEQQAGQVEATAAAIESKRRGTLGRWFLGEQVDIAAVDAELAAAKKQAEAIAPTAEGAAAAREYLQAQIDDINRRAAKIRADMEAARWEATRAEVSKRADAYRKACEAAEAAFLELIGAAQVADSLRPVDSAPRCYSSAAPTDFQFPSQPLLPELEGFKTYRRLYDQRARAEAAALAHFRDAGILEGAA